MKYTKKELKQKTLLGIDFFIWKVCRIIKNFAMQFVDFMRSIPADKIATVLEAAQGETEPETDEEGDMEVTKDHPRYKEFEGDYYDNTVEVEYTPKCRKS